MFSKSQLASAALSIDAVHDARHQLGDRPLARESIPYIVVLPEEQIAFFTYTWVSKDSVAGAALAIFGPGVGSAPIQQRLADRPVASDMNFDRWEIEGSSLRHDLKFEQAQVRWDSPAATVDFSFEASHLPYAYGSHPHGCPAYAADNRIEQSGRVKGTLRLGSREILFDATGHRDHSWGTRDWFAMQHYEWFVGQVGDDVSVHFWHIQALGRTEIRGYAYKEGLLAAVTGVEVAVEFDKDYWQQRYTAKITDEAGRLTTVSAEVFGHYTLVPDPGFHLRESGGRATIDGKQGVGWMEVAWPAAYLEHLGKATYAKAASC
jgi:hypothetical protein